MSWKPIWSDLTVSFEIECLGYPPCLGRLCGLRKNVWDVHLVWQDFVVWGRISGRPILSDKTLWSEEQCLGCPSGPTRLYGLWNNVYYTQSGLIRLCGLRNNVWDAHLVWQGFVVWVTMSGMPIWSVSLLILGRRSSMSKWSDWTCFRWTFSETNTNLVEKGLQVFLLQSQCVWSDRSKQEVNVFYSVSLHVIFSCVFPVYKYEWHWMFCCIFMK
jgi:hypothetical protein